MTENKPPIVELKNVSKWFPTPHNEGRQVTVNNVNLIIPDTGNAEFVVLLGPSGCGKSTMLHLIAGMLQADEGEVCIYGKTLAGRTPSR